jgi:hypothetical protein
VKTRKVEVTTRVAKAVFDVGHLPDLGDGGILLCRMVLDLMNAPPSAAVCGTDELPMRVEIRWTSTTSRGIAFEVTGVLKKTDMSAVLVPPYGAAVAALPFPAAGVSSMLSPSELAAFRSAPIDIPQGPFSTAEGLVLFNGTDQLRVAYVDGIPVAWAAPGARDMLRGLPRGRYVVQWRTFLGDAIEPPATMNVPGLAQVGAGDAGAPR